MQRCSSQNSNYSKILEQKVVRGRQLTNIIKAKHSSHGNRFEIDAHSIKKFHELIAIYNNGECQTKKQRAMSKTICQIISTKTEKIKGQIGLLRTKLSELKKLKEFKMAEKNEKKIKEENKKKVLANEIEELLIEYSNLSKATIDQKAKENNSFDNYTNICQEKEKITVDSKLSISRQKMKIKLLEETILNRKKQFNEVVSRNEELVLFK